MSAASASKENCMKLMSKGKSLTLNPGGVQEVSYLANRKVRTLFLKKRFGFTKLAMQSGAAIVPMFVFGQDKCYDYIVSDNKILLDVGRRMGFLPMLFFGLFGIPLGLPKPVPLTVVVGKPIKVPHIKEPTNEEIEKCHLEFMAATETIYNDNKADFGLQEVPLVIV